MRGLLQLAFLLVGASTCIDGQGLPFQVNSRTSCNTEISLDTTTLTGVKRGDDSAPCSGYLMYSEGGNTRRLCGSSETINQYAAERACYTLGVNFFRGSTSNPTTSRQMMLYRCFQYVEQNVDSVHSDESMSVWDFSYLISDSRETGCYDGGSDPSVFDCFDTCYFNTNNGFPSSSSEENCAYNEPFYALGCADINECVNGVRDHCTGPFETSCTIRKACGNNTDCTNHPGSFECSCKNGYEFRRGDEFDPYELDQGCIDIDECDEEECDEHAKCVNTPGSYFCWCKDGFTGDGKTCTAISCDPPPHLPNAVIQLPATSHVYEYTDTVVYTCHEGHKVFPHSLPDSLVSYYGYVGTESFTLMCDEKGKWEPSPYRECIPVECEDPGVIPNAYRSEVGFMYDQEVTYKCETGFRPEKYGSYDTSYGVHYFVRKCQADGTWTEGSDCVDIDECEEETVCTKYDQHCINTRGGYLCITNFPETCELQGGLKLCKNGECKMAGDQAHCVCDAGYEGLLCDRPITSTTFILAVVCIVLIGIFILVHLMVCCVKGSVCCPRAVAPACPPPAASPVYGGLPIKRACLPTRPQWFGRFRAGQW